MIIGETFNQYDGYEESYDYLFKKKAGGAPSPRQQKKAEKKAIRKAGKPAPKSRLMQKRQDKKAGLAPKRKLIMGNFGLFNKNKKKEEAAKAAAAATPNDTTQTDTENIQDAAPVEDTAQNQEMNSGAESNVDNTAEAAPEETPANPTPEESEGGEPSESSYDDTPGAPKAETKVTAKPGEKTGMGVWIGWGFLGLTVVMIGYTMYKLDQMEAKLPAKNNLPFNP